MEFSVAFIQTSCENMILPIVQLFWLALITRLLLLLLLAVLIILAVVTALIKT